MAPTARRKRGLRMFVWVLAGLLCLALQAPMMLSGRVKDASAALQSSVKRSLNFRSTSAASRGKVYLRYDVQLGLCNQLNSHVNGLMLAHALGVDAVVVPPAWSRSQDSFSRKKDDQLWIKNNPASTLLDLETMTAIWAQRGIQLLEESVTSGLRTAEWHTCVRTRNVEEQLRAAIKDPPKYLRVPLLRLVAQARFEIDAARKQHGPSACVLLDAGRMFWAAEFTSSANLAAASAATLRFPSHIEAIANRIAMLIGPTFNGVHLRVEADMELDPTAIIPKYIALMHELGFSPTTPLYVASGLLSYDDGAGFDRMVAPLLKENLCSTALAKERMLPAADFEGLNSEQLAMVDLLVLAQTARFVGHSVSTFSFVAHDLRLMRVGTNHIMSARLIDFPAGGKQLFNYMLPVDLSVVKRC